jgi:prepilin-type N-terminal cleavage/methylation domain-containing protein
MTTKQDNISTKKPTASEQCFTLIELLVVITILGIMAAASISWISTLFDSQIRATAMFDQHSELAMSFGWLNSHLVNADRPIGRLNQTGTAIDPLTLAGDQVVFEQNQTCYRVFWLKREKELRMASAANCNDSKVKPVRGPNQLALNGTYHAEEGDPDYDVALDAEPGDESASFVLAQGVVEDKPKMAPHYAPDPLQPLTYKDDTGQTVPVERLASNEPSTHPTYANPSERQAIAGIEVAAYVEARDKRISARSHIQTIWIKQMLNDSATAGAVPTQGRIDGAGTTNWVTVAANSIWFDVQRNPGADLLITPQIASQSGWVEFSGQLVIRPKSSSNISGSELRVQLVKNGTAVTTGRGSFNFPTGQVTGSRAIPFSGQFQIPVGTVDSLDNYRLRVGIRNSDSSNDLEYSTELSQTWINWKLTRN